MLDITSTSSYSELIQDVEWGYKRDKEQLAQINLCMLMGENLTSRLPIDQVVYSGSLKDVTTLKTTLSKMEAISGDKPVLTVMDKGFFSTRNVNAMLNRPHPIRFVVAVPFTSQFAKKMVASERKDIDHLQRTLVLGENSMRAVTRERAWDEKHRLYTHVYYHALKALKLREELYAHVTVLKERGNRSGLRFEERDIPPVPDHSKIHKHGFGLYGEHSGGGRHQGVGDGRVACHGEQ